MSLLTLVLSACRTVNSLPRTAACAFDIWRADRVARGALCAVVVISVISVAGTASASLAILDTDGNGKPDFLPLEYLDRFPIPGSVYKSTGGTTFPTGPMPIQLVTVTARDVVNNPIPNFVLPPPGETGVGEGLLDIRFDVADLKGLLSETSWTFSVTGESSGPLASEWNTELLSMSFMGEFTPSDGGGAADGMGASLLPIQFTIRESPTLQSLGRHVISDLPEGGWLIDSHFDVFFEISMDGGPFIPADNSMRLELTAVVPEASQVLVLGLLSLVPLVTAWWRRAHRG